MAMRVSEIIDGRPVARDMTVEEEAAFEAARAVQKVPVSVTRFQAKAALAQAGLLPTVEAAVASAGGLAALAWSDALEFHRDSPTIAALAPIIDLNSSQIDALFIAASGIRA